MTSTNSIIENFKTSFLQIDKNNLHLLELIYRDDIVFQDPLHKVEGLKALKDYFSHMYGNVSACTFSYHGECVGDNEAVIFWTMAFKHPKLNGNKEISVEGSSHLKFEHKVFYHRDYFDAGQMLYENVPLVGRVIKYIKRNSGQ